MTPREVFADMLAKGDMILDRFDAAVARHPAKTFIHYGEDDRHLSHAAFSRDADALAAGLVRLGVQPGDRVSVMTRNALVATLAMFAAWRAGAIYAPVNFNYTGRLLSYQLNDTRPAVLIVDPACGSAVAAVREDIAVTNFVLHLPRPGEHDFDPAATIPNLLPGTVVALEELLAGAAERPAVERSSIDLANIIYTSGTTGPAKGVLQSFRWIAQYTYIVRELNGPDDVVYCDLPLYHVGGAFFMLARACWHGNTVSLWDRFSPARFWDRITGIGATTAVLVDVMVPWLMSAEPRASDKANTLNKVHMQPLPMVHHQMARRFGFDFVTCGFGQTESGLGFAALVDELGAEMGTPAELWHGPSKDEIRAAATRLGVPVVSGEQKLAKGYMGQPSPLLEATALDEADNECSPGAVGQLAFRPRFPSLMLETYFNKPEVTLKAFRNLWFHTGDAVSKGTDGNWYFVDRMGGFFRVRGENVSSFQVEDLLNTHPKIRATAAVPIKAEVGEEEEVAVFIQLMDDTAMTEDELLDFAGEVMPKYMRPRHIRFIEELPLTPSSKIEKYKLKLQLLAELGRTS